VDFAYPDRRLAVETDGYASHSARSDWQHDRWRDNTLVTMQWQVLRFTWDDVSRRPDWVLEKIRLALDALERPSARTRLSDFH
jgi:very-short-patch-repair endonuclease